MLANSMDSVCPSCNKSKATLQCAICAASTCKTCAQFVDEESVAWLEPVPAYYALGVFCQACFEQKVEPELASYNEVLERAGQVNIFYKSESKESRFVRRIEKPIKVKDCIDREAAILKLAFLAAQMGFNILLDVELSFEKVRNGGWQTCVWQGRGIPGHVDESKLRRRFASTPN